MYALIQLKYDMRKALIARKDWLLKQKKVYSKTEDYFCYWSNDLNDTIEQMNCDYSEKFTGEPALLKVFVIKLEDSLEEAQKSLKGRMKTVAKRFRDPGNTDEELKQMEAKKRRSAKKELKELQAQAHEMNIEYLVDEINLHVPSTSNASNLSEAIVPDDLVSAKKQKSKKAKEDEAIKQPNHEENYIQEKKKKKELKVEQARTMNVEYRTMEVQPAEDEPLVQPNYEENDIKEKKKKKKKEKKLKAEQVQTMNVEYRTMDVQPVEEQKTEKEIAELSLPSTQLLLSDQPPSTDQPLLIDQPQSTEQFLSTDMNLSFDLTPFLPNNDEWLNNVLKDGLEFQVDLNMCDENIENTEPQSVISENTETSVQYSTTQVSEVSTAMENMPTNPVIVCNKNANIVTLDFDELAKRNNELSLEVKELKIEVNGLKTQNKNLQSDLVGANKRNLALQNYLVAVDERVPETLFVDKDKGRLYRGDVFLSEKQCSVLDKAKTDNEYMNNLLVCIFGRDILKTHSLTGKRCNRTKGDAKPPLDRERVNLIYDIMDARSVASKTPKLSKKEKNELISKKLSNVASYKPPGEKELNTEQEI